MARKTSAEDSLTDIMRLSLLCSDPMFAHMTVRSDRRKPVRDEQFETCLEYYYDNGSHSDSDESSEMDVDEEFEESDTEYDSSDDDGYGDDSN